MVLPVVLKLHRSLRSLFNGLSVTGAQKSGAIFVSEAMCNVKYSIIQLQILYLK